jgi:hypothetical protein
VDDLTSILLQDDEPTAQEKLAALTKHLQRQRAVGTLASLIGGPAKDFGRTLTAQASEGLQQAGEAPGKRLRMALERQQLASGAADAEQRGLERGYRNDPGSAMGTALRNLMAKYGQKVAPNATAAELLPVAPLAEKSYQVDENSRNRALSRQLMARNGSAAQDALSPEALDMLAEQFATTGALPALGMGKDAAALRMKIATRAAELHAGTNLAGNKANYAADTGSLKGLQRQADAINAFERTALANGEVFMQQARALGLDTGSPLFNAPFRKFAQQVAGDPKMASFVAARQTLVQEIGKILSGSMGNTPVSDSARDEAKGLLSPDASLAQIEAAYDILKKDMANRKQGLADQLAEIRGRTGGGNTPTGAPIPSAGAPAGGLSPEKAKRLAELRAKAAAGALQ